MKTCKVAYSLTPRDYLYEPDEWIPVPARSSGVKGLPVTAALRGKEPVGGRWTLTHEGSGRNVGVEFPSIAAARRAAKRVADVFDWSDPELVYDMLKPSSAPKRKEVKRRLREAGEHFE